MAVPAFAGATEYFLRVSASPRESKWRCLGRPRMTPLNQVEGRAIPFGLKNVDTDVIIPAHWLKTTTREGMGRGAFESLRADPDNLFDSADFKGAPILIAGDNFGCGSSRSEEHTSELQSLMRISYAVFCLKKKNKRHNTIGVELVNI